MAAVIIFTSVIVIGTVTFIGGVKRACRRYLERSVEDVQDKQYRKYWR